MPNTVVDLGVKRFYGKTQLAPQANGATGLAANRRAVNLVPGHNQILLYAAAAARLALCPKIVHVYFYDASGSDESNKWFDLLADDRAMVDGSKTSTSQFTMAEDTDFLYIATTDKVGGFRFDLDASLINDDLSTMVFEYSGQNQFKTTAVTDGTDTGTEMLAQDGNVTITTVPSDWYSGALKNLINDAPSSLSGESFYWSRISATSVTGSPLDAVEIEQLIALNVNPWTANSATAVEGESVWIEATTPYQIQIDPKDVGGFEVIAQSTSAATTMNVTMIKR